MRYLIATMAALALGACGSKPDDDPMTPASQSTGVAVPDGTPTGTVPHDGVLEAWLKSTYGEYGRVGYRSSEFDLDGDGKPELLIYVGGPGTCGSGGCSLVVLKREGDRFTPITETSVTRLPLGVMNTSSNGWRDLWVSIAGGGELGGRRALKFDGKGYPTNPTVPPAEEIRILDTQVLIEDGDLIWLD
ncbi:hypothetical protein GRI89_07370 [Altererythrobacter salegens]|uniref:Lipoprotein n=1 Tax=Croceibacterium salegens TaxID=1737568 RepID=A0A6I4SVH8_9SPHN|nr:hypothetical protein [Croceibacterium salegens]MXO59359.1 hypothetical protein [Croceibacterium salegens]